MRPDYNIEINRDQLAFRLMQIGVGMQAPAGTEPTDALNKAEATWPPGMVVSFPFRRMADTALEYFQECIEQGLAR